MMYIHAMNKNLVILALAILPTLSFGQNDIIKIVEEGIMLHENGEFDSAIATYETALKIDSKSPLVLYEIGLSYYTKGDFSNAIKYFDKVLKLDKLYQREAAINKGLALDYLGKNKAALKHFKKYVSRFENESDIHHNMGYLYFKGNDIDNAVSHLTKAIEIDPDYAYSHLLLGAAQYSRGKHVPAMLSYYYFLLLEPSSENALDAFYDIMRIMHDTDNINKDEPTKLNINMVWLLDTEFGPSEMFFCFLAAHYSIGDLKELPDETKFVELSEKLFEHLAEVRLNEGYSEGVYWKLYVPFFNELVENEHMEAYFYHMTEHIHKTAPAWIEAHTMEMFKFEKWLDR